MIAQFLRLEWKQFFRSSYWQNSIALKIILGIFALMMLSYLLLLGIFSFMIIEKVLPDSDPLQVVNSYLVFAFLGDLVFRYFMQKIPVMNIKPMLVLPINKSKLVHYVLVKSANSFFNWLPIFFYLPFAIVLITEGYSVAGAIGWFIAMKMIVLFNNYLNFLVNKNNTAFFVILGFLVAAIGIQYYEVFDIAAYAGGLFNTLFENPIYCLIPAAIALVMYYLNFKDLKGKVYLDDVISVKVKEAKTSELSWADSFGSIAPFLKNDIRLIWRNKRPKTVFLMSFFFVFYALIFFTQEVYAEKMPAFLAFAAVFTTGGFAINFGQFIPAWDSSYYKALMSQNIKYRLYLDSKWYLMVVMTALLYVLSIPYIALGFDKFLMITAGAIYNIGFNSLFLLFSGSFNRKRIDLDRSAFANYQGTSATQFVIILPLLGLPMLLFWIFSATISFNAGIIAIATVGVLTILFKNYFMKLIVDRYISNKYATISAFEKKS